MTCYIRNSSRSFKTLPTFLTDPFRLGCFHFEDSASCSFRFVTTSGGRRMYLGSSTLNCRSLLVGTNNSTEALQRGCKNLSVNCLSSICLHPCGVRRSGGERSKPQ